MAVVRNKYEMIELYEAGYFGNRIRHWFSLEELLESGYQGNVYVRSLGAWCLGQNFLLEDLTVEEAIKETEKLINVDMVPKHRIFYGEWVPTDGILLNCEIRKAESYYEMYYSRQKLPMRKALAKDGKYVIGLKALDILREVMDPYEIDAVLELFERYPDCVIELTVYNHSVGILGRCHLVWEVRNY